MCLAVSVVTVDSVACPSETPKYEKVFMTENSLNALQIPPGRHCASSTDLRENTPVSLIFLFFVLVCSFVDQFGHIVITVYC